MKDSNRPPGAAPDGGAAGLGLAIARQLAVAQGGTLTFAPRPGGGSTFALTLPAERLDQLGEDAGPLPERRAAQ